PSSTATTPTSTTAPNFGFWILDFRSGGLRLAGDNPKSKIQNPKFTPSHGAISQAVVQGRPARASSKRSTASAPVPASQAVTTNSPGGRPHPRNASSSTAPAARATPCATQNSPIIAARQSFA